MRNAGPGIVACEGEPECRLHRAFDRADADLAVPLRRVGVPAGEERPVAPDGQPERRSCDEVAAVDVAAAPVRRERADCGPGSSVGTPIVPRKGSSGTSTPGATVAVAPFRRSKILRNGSGKSSASRPNSGITAVHPHGPGVSSRISTSSVSPRDGALDVDRTGKVVDRVEVPDHVGDRRASPSPAPRR